MELSSYMISFSIFETLLLIGFIFYFIFPMPMSFPLAHMVISPWSFLVYFVITMYLFCYSHPVLAVMYIFFVYEMFSRSQTAIRQHLNIESVPNSHSVIKQKYLNTSVKNLAKQQQEAKQHHVVTQDEAQSTLETELVNRISPVGVGAPVNNEPSDYKPYHPSIGEYTPLKI